MNCLKELFEKLFNRRQQKPVSSDGISVIIDTEIELSEEQKNAIISIVKEGLELKHDFRVIGIEIMLKLKFVSNTLRMMEADDGVHVIIY